LLFTALHAPGGVPYLVTMVHRMLIKLGLAIRCCVQIWGFRADPGKFAEMLKALVAAQAPTPEAPPEKIPAHVQAQLDAGHGHSHDHGGGGHGHGHGGHDHSGHDHDHGHHHDHHH